jgi:hypothetical protein
MKQGLTYNKFVAKIYLFSAYFFYLHGQLLLTGLSVILKNHFETVFYVQLSNCAELFIQRQQRKQSFDYKFIREWIVLRKFSVVVNRLCR